MLGIVIKFITIRHFHNFAQIHHRHFLAEVANHTQIVGNEQISQVEFFPQVFQQVDDLGLDRNIQGRNCFITDDEFGVQGECPGDSNTLPLASAHFVGVTVCHHRRKSADVQEFGNSFIP